MERRVDKVTDGGVLLVDEQSVPVPRGLRWLHTLPGGSEWLAELPRLVMETAGEWQLTLHSPFESGSVA